MEMCSGGGKLYEYIILLGYTDIGVADSIKSLRNAKKLVLSTLYANDQIRWLLWK